MCGSKTKRYSVTALKVVEIRKAEMLDSSVGDDGCHEQQTVLAHLITLGKWESTGGRWIYEQFNFEQYGVV